MKQLLMLEIPYPNKSGNRAVRHGGGSHYLSRDTQAYREAVQRVAHLARVDALRLAGPLELRRTLSPPDGDGCCQANVLKVAVDALALTQAKSSNLGVLNEEVPARAILGRVSGKPSQGAPFELHLGVANASYRSTRTDGVHRRSSVFSDGRSA